MYPNSSLCLRSALVKCVPFALIFVKYINLFSYETMLLGSSADQLLHRFYRRRIFYCRLLIIAMYNKLGKTEQNRANALFFLNNSSCLEFTSHCSVLMRLICSWIDQADMYATISTLFDVHFFPADFAWLNIQVLRQKNQVAQLIRISLCIARYPS